MPACKMKRTFEGLPVLHSKKQRKDVKGPAKASPKFHRLDIALVISPDALVGRKLRVQWDDGKYAGVVEAFHPATQQHTIRYEDGDTETYILARDASKLELWMLPQEQLPPPSTAQLRSTAAALLEDAQKRLPQQQAGSTGQGGPPTAAAAGGGAAGAKQRAAAARISSRTDPQVLKEVESLQQRAKLLYKAADHLDAAAAALAAAPSSRKAAAKPQQQQEEVSAAVVTPAGAIQHLLQEGLLPANVPGLGYTHLLGDCGSAVAAAAARKAAAAATAGAAGSPEAQDQGQQLQQKLEEGHEDFQANRGAKRLCRELDLLLRVEPAALVGRQVRVYWPGEDAWFAGTVTRWLPATGQHQVEYDDGDTEQLWLGAERARLFYSPGEVLPAPAPTTLLRLAAVYHHHARSLLQQMGPASDAGCGPAAAAAAGDGSSSSGVEVDAVELAARSCRMADKAEQLLAAAALLASGQVPRSWTEQQQAAGNTGADRDAGQGDVTAVQGGEPAAPGSTHSKAAAPRKGTKAAAGAASSAPVTHVAVQQFLGAQLPGGGCVGDALLLYLGWALEAAAAGGVGGSLEGAASGAVAAAEEHAVACAQPPAAAAEAGAAAGAAADAQGDRAGTVAVDSHGTPTPQQQQQQEEEQEQPPPPAHQQQQQQQAAAPSEADLAALFQQGLLPGVRRGPKGKGYCAYLARPGVKSIYIQAATSLAAAVHARDLAAALVLLTPPTPGSAAAAAGEHPGPEAAAGEVDPPQLEQQQGGTASAGLHAFPRAELKAMAAKLLQKDAAVVEMQRLGTLERVCAIAAAEEGEPGTNTDGQQAAATSQPQPQSQPQQQAAAMEVDGAVSGEPGGAAGAEVGTQGRQKQQQQRGRQGQQRQACPAGGPAEAAPAPLPATSRGTMPPDVAAAAAALDAAAVVGASAVAGGSSLLPGEVLWVQPPEKGSPLWPGMVISWEEADDWRSKLPATLRSEPLVCVQLFGSYGRHRVPLRGVVGWGAGLPGVRGDLYLAGLRAKEGSLSYNYRLALREVGDYLTGVPGADGHPGLPDYMIPDHNTEAWEGVDEQQQEEGEEEGGSDGEPSQGGAPAPRAASRTKGGAVHRLPSGSTKKIVLGDVKFPLQLGPHLVLEALGRVEFLHPGYHNDRHIWPVGYAARRLARTPASGMAEVWHRVEVVEAPDGSGPLFRVTPEGGRPITSNSCADVWAQLHLKQPPQDTAGAAPTTAAAAGGDGSGSGPAAGVGLARSLNKSGPQAFGLTHPVVRALLHQLPAAGHCERYMGWEGDKPEVPDLTPEQQLLKVAAATRLQALPPGITPLPFHHPLVGKCDACGEEVESEGDLLIECDRCRLMVHMGCYGVQEYPDGSWLCDVCRLPGVTTHPPCVLCPRVGGALKSTSDGRWCHLLCATWVPGPVVHDEKAMGPILGISTIAKARRALLCCVCKQPYGACIQCAGSSKCYAAFHPTCARDAGFTMCGAYDEDSDSSDGEEEGEAGPGPVPVPCPSGMAGTGAAGGGQEEQRVLQQRQAQQQQQRQGAKRGRQAAAAPDGDRSSRENSPAPPSKVQAVEGDPQLPLVQQQQQQQHAAPGAAGAVAAAAPNAAAVAAALGQGKASRNKGRLTQQQKAKQRRTTSCHGHLSKEGTCVGDNLRLFCFCRKHQEVGDTPGYTRVHVHPPGTFLAGARRAGSGAAVGGGGVGGLLAAGSSQAPTASLTWTGGPGAVAAAAGINTGEVTSPPRGAAAAAAAAAGGGGGPGAAAAAGGGFVLTAADVAGLGPQQKEAVLEAWRQQQLVVLQAQKCPYLHQDYHDQQQQQQQELSTPVKGAAPPQQQQPARATSSKGSGRARGSKQGGKTSQGKQTAAAAAAATAATSSSSGPLSSCARASRLDLLLRRGLKAPEALAAALSKRRYLQQLPWLVTSCTHPGQLLPPPLSRARVAGPEFEACKGQLAAAGGRRGGLEQLGGSSKAAGEQQQQQQQGGGKEALQAYDRHQRRQVQRMAAAAAAASAAGDAASGPVPAPAAAAAGGGGGAVSGSLGGSAGPTRGSLWDRYQAMRDSVADRLTPGKSAIHGWGAFAKVAHRAGDLVLEYSGSLVRPVVADRLEATTYNRLVGAGTYIFRLNDHLCVDATRAGNIAHLLNHSCAPCCHSRTITVTCPATGRRSDHVVICASRDIAAGEELTYDYRFAGDEKLRCNCGAGACRGWVNLPRGADSPDAQGRLQVLQRELVTALSRKDRARTLAAGGQGAGV